MTHQGGGYLCGSWERTNPRLADTSIPPQGKTISWKWKSQAVFSHSELLFIKVWDDPHCPLGLCKAPHYLAFASFSACIFNTLPHPSCVCLWNFEQIIIQRVINAIIIIFINTTITNIYCTLSRYNTMVWAFICSRPDDPSRYSSCDLSKSGS